MVEYKYNIWDLVNIIKTGHRCVVTERYTNGQGFKYCVLDGTVVIAERKIRRTNER